MGRRGRRGLRDRPARLVADGRRRPQVVVGKTETAAALAEGRDLERELGAANAGTRNRVDPDQVRALSYRARFEARDFSLGPPRLALLGLKKSATATRQRNKDEGADEIQTNSARHTRNFNEFI